MKYLLPILMCACLLSGCAVSRLGLDQATAPLSSRKHDSAPAKASKEHSPQAPAQETAPGNIEAVQASYPGDPSLDRL